MRETSRLRPWAKSASLYYGIEHLGSHPYHNAIGRLNSPTAYNRTRLESFLDAKLFPALALEARGKGWS
jgi:hypothetical protein